MAVRPAVAGVGKHEILFTHANGQIGVNTVWTYLAGAVTGARLAAERTVIETWLNAGVNGWKTRSDPSVTATMTKAWAFDVSPPTKIADHAIGVVPTNRRTVAALPFPLSAAIALRTQAVGALTRGINGRLYHCGLADSDISGSTSVLTGAAVTALKAVYEKLRADLVAGAGAGCGVMAVISFFDAGTRDVKVIRGAPLVMPVDHILLSDIIAVQRRRRNRQQSFTLGS